MIDSFLKKKRLDDLQLLELFDLFAQRHLVATSWVDNVTAPRSEDLERFKELWDGALLDDRV